MKLSPFLNSVPHRGSFLCCSTRAAAQFTHSPQPRKPPLTTLAISNTSPTAERAPTAPKAAAMLSRSARSPLILLRPSLPVRRTRQPSQQLYKLSRPLTSRRHLYITPRYHKGLQPHSEDPKPPEAHIDDGGIHVREPAKISVEEYHEIADEYIDGLVATLEEKAETAGSGFDVEYSAGVLTLKTSQGTYVLNKQPPNKQIWISSPISGPKRYDWVLMTGEGQNQKEGTGMDVEGDLRGGQWVYLRDGSTLTDLLKKELDVQMNPTDDY